MNKRTFVGECGHTVWSKEAKTCRSCWEESKRKTPKTCEDCGKVLIKSHKGGVSKSKRCRDCQSERQRKYLTCAGCGEKFPSGGRSKNWTRCRPCSDQYRRNRPKKMCTKCGNYPQKAKSLCKNCYKTKWYTDKGLRNVPGRNGEFHQLIRNLPCLLCGYSKLTSHAHRLVPKKGYVDGNAVPLCPRCHEEVHRGVAALPNDIRLLKSSQTP